MDLRAAGVPTAGQKGGGNRFNHFLGFAPLHQGANHTAQFV